MSTRIRAPLLATCVLPACLALASLSFAQPPSSRPPLPITNALQLQRALAEANRSGGNVTLLLADGTYAVTDTLDVEAPRITIAGQAGHRARVVIQGDAMSPNARIGNLIRVAASHFELHDVTLQRSRYHLIQIAGEAGAQAPHIHDCILRDSYEQMLKVSISAAHPTVTSNDGLIENCIFEYTAGIGPEWYIGGIDAHGAKRWTVRGNLFRAIASPAERISEFAVHFWDGSADNVVERNTIINCDRGIGFGLDHSPNSGGIIRNNMIYHAADVGTFGDVGIALISSAGTQIYSNTVFFDDSYPNAIEYRFASTHDALITNNLSNRAIVSLDGATGTVASNRTP